MYIPLRLKEMVVHAVLIMSIFYVNSNFKVLERMTIYVMSHDLIYPFAFRKSTIAHCKVQSSEHLLQTYMYPRLTLQKSVH